MSAVTFSGRAFTTPEIDLMREIARDYAGLGVTEIARTVCELLDWKRPSGGLKNHECRLLLEHLRSAGMLTIAEAQRRTELFLTAQMLEGRRFGFGYLPTAL